MRTERLTRNLQRLVAGLLLAVCVPATILAQPPQTATEQNSQDAFDALTKSAAAARDSGKTGEAIRDYQRALALHADWQEGWWYLGTLEYDANQYADAIEALQKLTQLNPRLGPGWAFLGLSEYEAKDYENSLAHLEKAQELGFADDTDLARVSIFHLALLHIHDAQFERAAMILGSAFSEGGIPKQARGALGLAMLRIPLLPTEINPSKDNLIEAAGDVAALLLQLDSVKAIEGFQNLVRDYPTTPYIHYAYGIALAAASRNEEALAQEQKEAEISPASPLPEIEISVLEAALQHPQESLRAAQSAVRLAPNSAAAHRALSQSLKAAGEDDESAREAHTADGLLPEKASRDEAIVQLYSLHAASETPPSDQDMFKRAMSDFSAEKYSDAISSLKIWVVGHPDDGTAWAVMGLSEFNLQDFDNALIHLQRGQQLGLKASQEAVQLAHYALGSLLNRSGQFDRALEILAHEDAGGALGDRIQIARGMALLHIPMLPEHVEAPGHPLLMAAGEIAGLLEDSEYDDAIAKFQMLVADNPTTPYLHYAYGTALAALSRYDAAEEQMKAESKISPKSEAPWVSLASIELKQHRPADALGYAQRALDLTPNSAEAHYSLGRVQLDLGHPDLAIRELETASRLAPNSPEIHFNLAKAYTKTNQPEKAEAERAIFVRLNTLAEQQRSQNGDQSYLGPRQTSGVTTPNAEGNANTSQKPN